MKKLLFAVLFAAACGGTQKQSAGRSAAIAECTYSMPDTASWDEVQQAVADAEDGSLDVCGDQLSAEARASESGYHAVLEQIDADRADAAYLLRFKIYSGRIQPSMP